MTTPCSAARTSGQARGVYWLHPLVVALTLLGTTHGARGATPIDGAALEQALRTQGLVDVATLVPTLAVDLRYSTPENFMHADVYGSFARCYLQPEVAKRLVAAAAALAKAQPESRLLVYDCARPRRVQVIMWELVKGTPEQRYVASPKAGSIHNFGAAVDLTLADAQGKPLDMGSPYDFFGDLAEPRHEERLLASGALTAAQLNNRRLLRTLMTDAGFRSIPNEWWHFDAYSRAQAKARFAIVE